MKLKNTLMALAALTATASAASISVNFDIANGSLNAGNDITVGTAGLGGSSSWNNLSATTSASGSSTDLVDSAAATTTADIAWTSNTSWSNGGTATNDEKLLFGYLDDNGAAGVNIDVTSITYASYDVIVYFNNDFSGGGAIGLFDITANGTTATTVGAYTAGTAITDATNSLTITGLSGDLNLSSGFRSNPGLSTVSGFEIIDTTAIPEPSSTALLGLGGLALILRRRK